MKEHELRKIQTDLIKAVQEIAQLWDVSVASTAIAAVRSGDAKVAEEARRVLARQEACDDMKAKVLDKINIAFTEIKTLMKAGGGGR